METEMDGPNAQQTNSTAAPQQPSQSGHLDRLGITAHCALRALAQEQSKLSELFWQRAAWLKIQQSVELNDK